MSFMDDDDKNAQLTRTFFSASENEAANIKLAMSYFSIRLPVEALII